ncbi:hydroxymyristoyl-ACP dehydratase [Treponema sp.]|uniref:ApeI family dehydratase n=1 Tax=Treponema sp. TaxID=166 RepID=UPI0025D9846F|nr:hydroxymyristoyl-ACP dehydratase [Treponema sp.]MCR5218045.1 hydroxymyristoyl-ACP dehydratase [Treponema sp.]
MEHHSIENEKIISRTEDSLEIEFVIPAECDFFDGHFPEFKLLPAVAQVQIVTRFASEYFGTGPFVFRAKRLKFLLPILPDSKVGLSLAVNKEKKSVTFSFLKNQKDCYSTGTYYYE